jgi:hypothetical protein
MESERRAAVGQCAIISGRFRPTGNPKMDVHPELRPVDPVATGIAGLLDQIEGVGSRTGKAVTPGSIEDFS